MRFNRQDAKNAKGGISPSILLAHFQLGELHSCYQRNFLSAKHFAGPGNEAVSMPK
jgi:hypothetical protein